MDGHHAGIGEAGSGPGVEREAVEEFSKGLIAGGNLEGRGTVGTYEGKGSGLYSGTDTTVTNFKTNTYSAIRSSDAVHHSTGTSHDQNDFALFRHLESTHNNKILYVPVPVQYQHMDNKSSALKSTQSSTSSSVRSYSNHCYQSTTINEQSQGQGQGQGQGHGQIGRLLSFGLLELGFRSFGLLVGHFVLRRIVSADYNSQVRTSK